MAIQDFKKVEGTRGYFVDDKDRNIFEREISKGYFGMNVGDLIEFIIYDSNDNQLPQESNGGKLVRYIEYNDNTEKKYFGKVQKNKQTLKANDSDEFFIDTEKLIKEAGYSQGIFKTQISLVNRRLGSETRVNDKVWIHEISPSRTEVRLLPLIDDKKGRPNSDLQRRYDCFIKCEMFKSDVYPFINQFLNQFDVELALKNLLGSKGKVASGKQYIDLIQSEFKIRNFEIWLSKVKDKMIESANHWKEDRNYNITSSYYGKPLVREPKLCYKENEVLNIIETIVEETINYYLPKRNIKEDSTLTFEQQKTFDKVESLLKTVTSNEQFVTQVPDETVVGCKDPDALNYNPNADVDDRSLCVYPLSEVSLSDRPKPKPTDVKPNKPIVKPKPVDTPPPLESKFDPFGGNQIDNPADRRLILDTFQQVNSRAMELELQNSGTALEPAPLDITGAGGAGVITISANQYDNLTASDRINLGSRPSVVLDGTIKDRVIREI
jgi:hypothetical protein